MNDISINDLKQQIDIYFNKVEQYNNIDKEMFNLIENYLKCNYPKYLSYNFWKEHINPILHINVQIKTKENTCPTVIGTFTLLLNKNEDIMKYIKYNMDKILEVIEYIKTLT
jgi:hypothetical protein